MKKFRSEKGLAGIDIGVSVIIIFMFASLIAVLFAGYTNKSREIKLKSEATYLAISEIEKIKSEGFSVYENMDKETVIDREGNSLINQPIDQQEGFYKSINIEDYADINTQEGIQKNLVKRITVKISYKSKGEARNVRLSTILSKES